MTSIATGSRCGLVSDPGEGDFSVGGSSIGDSSVGTFSTERCFSVCDFSVGGSEVGDSLTDPVVPWESFKARYRFFWKAAWSILRFSHLLKVPCGVGSKACSFRLCRSRSRSRRNMLYEVFFNLIQYSRRRYRSCFYLLFITLQRSK